MKSKLFTLAIAFSIAFAMWYYVITVVSPEQERTYNDVTVNLEGESLLRDRQLMIISDKNLVVDIELKGSRQNLNNINTGNLVLIADLSGIYDPGEHKLGYSVGYPGNVPAGSVTVMNKEPSTVTVIVAERVSRSIPVRVEYLGNAADGFVADTPQAVLEYEEVVITGPKETVEQIDHAYILVDCTDRTEHISESYRFVLRNEQEQPVDAALITTNIEQIRVQVPVFLTKRIPLVLTVNPGGGATEELTSIVFDTEYIDVSGSESALASLEELVLGTLNLGDIHEDTERTYTITLPEGVTNLSGITEVKVQISFPELAKKEFVITNIRTLNVPEGMMADLLTKQLTIWVRGPKDLMEMLTSGDITVTIDLTGVENTAAVEAKITFPPKFSSLGAVGKYSVSVHVKPEEVTPVTEPEA